MATDYFSDNEAFITSHPLPSPADTQYHSVSRRTSRYGTPASEAPSSPAPMPPTPRMGSDDVTDDENISVLDPRRFTPTLHASLVSEILNLRRELDSKHKFIDDLETNLHTVRTENDTLTSELSSTTKEGRTLKRQLQQLENGTLSALEEIASERDKAKEANADLKEKLEATQKKLKGQEDDSTRVHDMWAREKDAWAGEKRALERRVHVTETRLKLLLDEIAMQEAAIEEEVDPESEGDELARDGGVGHESDTASVRSSPQRRPSSRFARHSRNHSNSSFRSIGRNYRMSLMSVPGSEGTGRVNGVSLADELIFDEEEEEYEELEIDSDDFPENEMRARRALESRQSMYPDEKAKRILGLSLEKQHGNKDIPSSTPEDEPPKSVHHTAQSSATITPQEITLIFPPPGPMYVDTGYQPSPPSSPVRPDTAESTLPAKSPDTGSSLTEVEANQSRKRVSVPIGAIPQYGHIIVPSRGMTSSSSQTVDQPLSPPDTPKIDIPATQIPASPVFKPEVASVSTQTEPAEEPAVRPSTPPPPPLPTRAPPPAPLPIPSIAIHAPTSAPASPKEPILPPGTKTIGTQTSGDMTGSMCSTGMQTEPIRIDKRPVKLPPHLLPSSISSKPGTPEPGKDRPGRKDSAQPVAGEAGQSTARPNARQDLLALLERVADRTTDKTAEKTVEDRYPGNNDNGPLARDKELGISRPFRTSSLFAGFDGPSSDEEDNDAELSDDEEYRPTQYSTPMLSSRNLKNGRVFYNPPTPVPEDKEVVSNPRPSEDSVNSSRMLSNRSSMEKPAKVGKPIRTSITRQSSIRRSAMIQNGTAAHMRSRSPSIGSVGSNNHTTRPPFPVPTRSSSRKIPLSKSEGSQSPTSRNSGTYSGRRPYGTRQHQRKDSLRKVRSAAVIQKSGRSGSRSPPLPATPTIPPSPSLPPLPNDLITGRNYGHRHQLSTNTSHTGSASVGSAGQQANVVDAIAATMIGEFMWKYVRKRKTFGGPESPADVSRTGEDLSSNGVRHRRWVWISPYERSILWSTKQPTSNSALMGKSGRKLTIQSVLDVADNTPLPKNAGTQALFNRSILILTPARALKFTAVTRERHYMWLTALSFLAHSSSPIPEMEPAMPIAPPAPMEELAPRSQGATLRRSHVRDSVRLAKGKANPVASRYAMQNEPLPELYPRSGADRPVPDSASPPSIPRGPYHGRKRSSTGPGAPPPSIPYRSFSHQHVPSLYSNGSSDMYSAMAPPSVPSSVYNPHSAITSSRTSEASTSTRQNFFDTMGTVRMEAFIDGALGDPNKRSEHARPRMMGRRRNSQWSSSTTNDLPLRVPGLYEDLTQESNDPFRGF